MKRREFLSRGVFPLAFMMVPLLASAASAGTQSATAALPYVEVSPVKEDANRVLVFFSFHCSVCRSLHASITNWAATLPQPVTFEFVPVLEGDTGSMVAARSWYLVKEIAPTQLASFTEAAYHRIHELGGSLDNPSLWALSARDAGVKGFTEAWANQSKTQVLRAAEFLKTYPAKVTPTMVIGGRYLITPDDTNGDFRVFLSLANGLISKAIVKK